MAFKPGTPLHVREGFHTHWWRWFAWHPVRTEQGRWVWLRHTYRRLFWPPMWFCPPGPHGGVYEHSDVCRGFWDA